MLVESFVAATETTSAKSNVSFTLKDVGIVLQEFQSHNALRHGFKKSSIKANSLAISSSHIYAAQADKAVVHVYNREKGNQEATVSFSERISSLAFVGHSTGFLVCGTEGGRVLVWEVMSGRQSASIASHLQAVSQLVVLPGNNFILSGSSDSNVHVWSLPKLVSFVQPQSVFSNEPAANAPLRAFAQHRSKITALACGHSCSASNFAVSASGDGVCYIWNVSDCQLLKTILYPSSPLCLVVDPADRALYSGHGDGSILSHDFYQNLQTTQHIHTATSEQVELRVVDAWSSGPDDIGATQCITLSYDGTILLSGHPSGRIMSWDVARRRFQKQVTDLGQSVTNIVMQPLEGLVHSQIPHTMTKTIVKPTMNNIARDNTGTSGVASDYSVKVQTMQGPPQTSIFQDLLISATFPQSLVDEALLELDFPSLSHNGLPEKTAKEGELQDRIEILQENLAIFIAATEKSRARRLARVEKREELKQTVADSDDIEERKTLEAKSVEIDMLSDEEELGEEVYADV